MGKGWKTNCHFYTWKKSSESLYQFPSLTNGYAICLTHSGLCNCVWDRNWNSDKYKMFGPFDCVLFKMWDLRQCLWDYSQNTDSNNSSSFKNKQYGPRIKV